MDYQLYEILLLFSIYSIAGWIFEVFLFALQNRGFQNRGICYGPYLSSFGFGALGILYGNVFLEENFTLNPAVSFGCIFVLGVAAGLVMWFASALVINGFCGAKVIHLKWYYPVLAGFGAWILVFQLNPLMTLIIRWLPSWIHMIFLLAYWVRFFPELVDGIIEMKKFKKTHTLKRHAE